MMITHSRHQTTHRRRSKTTHRRRPQTTHKTLTDLCKGEIDEKDEWWLPTLDIKLPTEWDQKLPTEGDHKLPTRL
jgi:hypothetical protein